MSDIDLSALQELAEGATGGSWTPGPWDVLLKGTVDFKVADTLCSGGVDRAASNAAYIAAIDPPTLLALLDRLAVAEAAVARVEELADEWAALPATWVYETAGEISQVVKEALRPPQDARSGPGAPASTEVAPGSTDALKGAQNRLWTSPVEALKDRHRWDGGYHCGCGADINSPQTWSTHVLTEAWTEFTKLGAEGARIADASASGPGRSDGCEGGSGR